MTPEVEYSDVQAENYHDRRVNREEEYSDKQADKTADEQNEQEQKLATAYNNFIDQHEYLTEKEREEYRSAISMDEKLKWVA